VGAGTAASGVAILAYWCILRGLGVGPAEAVSAGLALAFALVTVLWGGEAERTGGARDPGWIVSDEAAGQLLAALGLGGAAGLALAFVGFRLFDIAKPFPIGRLQKLPGGWGILIDDVAAAAVTAGLIRLAGWMAPGWGLLG
jgi:phosphatidylglycerophosphatase A